ncbi:Methylcobalamin:coenzyme M methyltransferase MtbA [Methanonatronarchaeum thermophilum]|uniref:Methylcobalamin:coenzyme M methyltransferase MtbA n=1 Tax=Methanonatronarchaeum thermophilum TaxID=1927129 RepID=A0A1Y3GCF1_9EURY|nr:uroporphyrinogen decarboxylase family protein [Methanonatronarchaeum thermophilum]OUJ19132.1 Methylcobalamin:coenzyme M methyltransferase MtbA [Methanonatronarchaeum thermophilum]
MPREDFLPNIDEEWLAKAATLWTTPFADTPSDRVIVDPILLSHAATLFRKDTKYFWQNPDEAVRMVCNACEIYDITPVGHYLWGDYWGQDYGAKLKYTEKSPPVIDEYPLKEPEDVDKLEVKGPEELKDGPTFEKHLTALDTCLDEYPDMFAPVTQFNGAFDIASNMVQAEQLLMWLIREPEIVDDLVYKMAEHMVNANKVVADRYGMNVMIAGSVVANGDLLNRDQIERFNFEPTCKAVKDTLKAGAGPGVYYHLCGEHKDDWDLWTDAPMSPFTVFQIGYEDGEIFPADKLVENFGDKATTLGVVDTSLVQMGSPREVYDQASEQLKKGKDSPRGFILGTACECPTYSPVANIHAMVRAAKDHGQYERF